MHVRLVPVHVNMYAAVYVDFGIIAVYIVVYEPIGLFLLFLCTAYLWSPAPRPLVHMTAHMVDVDTIYTHTYTRIQ